MKLLLDTNTLSYVLKGRTPVLDRMAARVQERADFLLAPVVHYELKRYLDLKGAHRLARAYATLTESWRRLELDFSDWHSAAELWTERHRAGKAVSDLDLFLAILAHREDAILVTANTRHFEGLGVAVEDWTLPGK
jgi:predicted nucleic acid-binding protein